MEEHEWDLLLGRIQAGRCTPFLGAGACEGLLPSGRQLAEEWARRHNYPLDDCHDLARVAQFLAVTVDSMHPKELLLNEFSKCSGLPDFSAPDEPHGVMARLSLPVYMTTNYDDFMYQALRYYRKEPEREMCRWNSYLQDVRSVFDSPFEATPKSPVVFHLHGHDKHHKAAESLVLTEDDYLDFLSNISKAQGNGVYRMLPPRIREAVAGASLLFVGYRLSDWSFRVLYRGLVTAMEPSLRRINVTVQLPPRLQAGDPSRQKSAMRYLEKYFGKSDVRVYWGTAREFSSELHSRCRKRGIL